MEQPRRRRVAVSVEGVVQGVGFRPYVFRLATEHELAGWVLNRPDGVLLEVEGAPASVAAFLRELPARLPPAASISRWSAEDVPAQSEREFRILPSGEAAERRPSIPADLATCPDCLQEVEGPGERRFRYPFTNCTNCGPRYSIIEGLPYDRPRTSMKGFPLCPGCEAEYRSPSDRRFHAQPIACPQCGPQLELLAADGTALALREDALARAAAAVREGRVLALKGLGGFQLVVDASDESAVASLRLRKRREAKPFAVMFEDLRQLGEACTPTPEERAALCSPQAPIVLLERTGKGAVCEGVAPGNPRLGVFLPYTPLHRLLVAEVGRPVVCTSGNLSDEPMCIDTREALTRLAGIADYFLVHDRPVVRPVDDSLVRMDAGGMRLLRRARGFAPLPLPLPSRGPCVLALGGQLKSTVALALGDQLVLSQHLGDLDSAEGAALLERTVQDLLQFFGARPEVVACDLHPDYASTRLAERLADALGARLERVQHHHAHAAACALDAGTPPERFLGLGWDGTGFGPDGSVWGGEALLLEGGRFERVARLRPFPLPGGDLAAREPRRAALGLLFARSTELAQTKGRSLFPEAELRAHLSALHRGAAPTTSSIGRLFDALSALCGLRARNLFEGQAAMELEFASERWRSEPPYPFPVQSPGQLPELDWQPALDSALSDLESGAAPGAVGARFHAGLASGAVSLASLAGTSSVALSGGCFQNALLSGAVRTELLRAGYQVLEHRRIPPNDGGIAAGQAWIARLRAVSDAR